MTLAVDGIDRHQLPCFTLPTGITVLDNRFDRTQTRHHASFVHKRTNYHVATNPGQRLTH
jgi:hypothetical protein